MKRWLIVDGEVSLEFDSGKIVTLTDDEFEELRTSLVKDYMFSDDYLKDMFVHLEFCFDVARDVKLKAW
ncbi:MAG: hypothetical protein DDT23_00036 [candidate division WS2 bacterium]|nr:hypothetical protein [Candidatus Lithacetigena glycinireducens]